MANWWSTRNKRIYSVIAMAIVSLNALSSYLDLPSFLTTEYGGFTLLTIAGVYTIYSAYQVYMEEI